MDAVDIAAIITVSLNVFIIVPIIVYFLYQYRRNAETQLIQHRSNVIVYLMSFCVTFALVFERSYALYIRVIQRYIQIPIILPTWTDSLLFDMTWTAILVLFGCKAYNLYFQQQVNLAISDMSWRQTINPLDENWYIKHKKTFGNPLYLIKVSFIPYFTFIVIEFLCITSIGAGVISDALHFLFACIPISIVMYLSYKVRYPGIDDIYYIKTEIMYQSFVVSMPFIIFTVITIISHVLCYMNQNCNVLYNKANRIEWIVHNLLLQWIAVGLTLFNTAYPLYVFQSELYQRSLSIHIESKRNISISAICDIMSDYYSFKTFMQYLVTEFSTENLLFLSELIQIKHAFQLQNNNLLRVPKQSIIQHNEFTHALELSKNWDADDFDFRLSDMHQFDIEQLKHDTNVNVVHENKEQNNENTNIQLPECKQYDIFKQYTASRTVASCVDDLPVLCRDGLSNMNDDQNYMVIDFNVEFFENKSGSTTGTVSPSLQFSKSVQSVQSNSAPTLQNKNNSLSLSEDITLVNIFTYLFDEIGRIRCRLTLPLELPQSLILIENKTNLHNQMKQLYNKYVKFGSQHELNISYEMRNCLKQFFQSKQIHTLPKYKNYKLFNVMDECGYEILLLMKDPFQRFVASKSYKKWLLNQLSVSKSKSKSKSSVGTASPTTPGTPGATPIAYPATPAILRHASSFKKLRQKYGFKLDGY